MTDDPRDELREGIDELTEEQARTMLGWTRALNRERRVADTERSVGSLGDTLGIVSEVQERGRSRMRLAVDPAWHNPNGVLHGGVIYTMIDYSMGAPSKTACRRANTAPRSR